MRYRGDYTSDLGHTFYNVPLVAAFVDDDGVKTTTDDPGLLLPLTFRNSWPVAQPADKLCALPLTPRRAILYPLSGGGLWEVDLPWQPGSTFWQTFFTETKVNPLINWSESVGEVIQPYTVSLLLR